MFYPVLSELLAEKSADTHPVGSAYEAIFSRCPADADGIALPIWHASGCDSMSREDAKAALDSALTLVQ